LRHLRDALGFGLLLELPGKAGRVDRRRLARERLAERLELGWKRGRPGKLALRPFCRRRFGLGFSGLGLGGFETS